MKKYLIAICMAIIMAAFGARAENPVAKQLVKELQEQVGQHEEIFENWFLDIDEDGDNVLFTVTMNIPMDEMFALDEEELKGFADEFVQELVHDFGDNREQIKSLFKQYDVKFYWNFRNPDTGYFGYGMDPDAIFSK